MRTLLSTSQIYIDQDVILDGRLALYHEGQSWLAVADLHFGYELSQRRAGRLMPLWGMESTEARLMDLLDSYEPRQLLLLGDLAHDHASAQAAQDFVARLQDRCETILLAGNHDRHLRAALPMVDTWETDRFRFQHGHCVAGTSGKIQIIGHHHPAGTITDGAGLRLKLPAFVQTRDCWILPAFSPWAAGAAWRADASSQIWLCSPKRVLRLPQPP